MQLDRLQAILADHLRALNLIDIRVLNLSRGAERVCIVREQESIVLVVQPVHIPLNLRICLLDFTHVPQQVCVGL